MVTKSLYVSLKAKPGKEAEVEAFLKSALTLVDAEPDTVVWFALKEGPGMFSIFDAFPDETGREAHLAGKVAEALMAKAGELLSEAPTINKIEVLASKLAK